MPNCVKLKELLDECEEAVESGERKTDCAEELIDFIGCVDKCVSCVDYSINYIKIAYDDGMLFQCRFPGIYFPS